MLKIIFLFISSTILPFAAIIQHQETISAPASLQFKEEAFLSDNDLSKITKNAQTALDKINNGEDFAKVVNQEIATFGSAVEYETTDYTFKSDLRPAIKKAIVGLSRGEHASELVETDGFYTINSFGKVVEETGLAIIKLLDTKEVIKNEKEVYVNHILISYDEAQAADGNITRSEEEAWDLINKIKMDLKNGDNFTTLAKKYSDDSANKDQGGKLEQPVSGDGTYAYDFELAALKLEQAGQISEIIKSQFGYHLIKADKVNENVKETQYQYDSLTYSTIPEPWADTGLDESYLLSAEVQLDNFYDPYVLLTFNDEGAEIFAELTEKNIGKALGIFVNDELISAPIVNDKITGGTAQIAGNFTMDEAKALSANLNAAIGTEK